MEICFLVELASVKLTSHLRMDGWNASFLLKQGLFFRGRTVGFQGVYYPFLRLGLGLSGLPSLVQEASS